MNNLIKLYFCVCCICALVMVICHLHHNLEYSLHLGMLTCKHTFPWVKGLHMQLSGAFQTAVAHAYL